MERFELSDEIALLGKELPKSAVDYLKLQYANQTKLAGDFNKSFIDLAVEYRFISEGAARTLRGQEDVDLDSFLSFELCRRYLIRAARFNLGRLYVECAEPLSSRVKELLSERIVQRSYGKVERVVFVPGRASDIFSWLKIRGGKSESLAEVSELLIQDPYNAISITRFLDALFSRAVDYDASDIHMRRDNVSVNNVVSMRIDGEMRHITALSSDSMAALTSRIKADANLDVSNTQSPQDGRMFFTSKSGRIDLRIASMPLVSGEKLTIRLFNPSKLRSIEDSFEFYPDLLDSIKKLLEVKKGVGGLVLVSGVTGSGKTTTLYSMIEKIDRAAFTVMTAEDPVEYEMPLVYQTQVNEFNGLSLNRILTSQLRADPDVLLVGEIRDHLTAENVIRSADTGHLVFSSLHTDDALSTVNRLITMLDPKFAVTGKRSLASTLRGIINQKLARRLCGCSQTIEASEVSNETLEFYSLSDVSTLRRPVGCSDCGGTGYRGRVVAPEVMFFGRFGITSARLQDAIAGQTLTQESFDEYGDLDHHSLRTSCTQLLKAGLIDLFEADRLMERT